MLELHRQRRVDGQTVGIYKLIEPRRTICFTRINRVQDEARPSGEPALPAEARTKVEIRSPRQCGTDSTRRGNGSDLQVTGPDSAAHNSAVV